MFRLALGWMAQVGRAAAAPSRADMLAHLQARSHFQQALPPGRLASVPYVVFDLETTGLSPTRGDAIVSIGAVRVRGAELRAESFATLVNPGRPIPAESTRYHGITDAMVATAPPMAAALAAFRTFCGEDVLVAHNAGFDMTCLHVAEFRGAPPTPNPALCSLVLSQWLDPQEQDHSLDGLAARLDEVIAGRHDALGDAEATARIFCRLLARADARGVDDLEELFRRTRMRTRIAAASGHF